MAEPTLAEPGRSLPVADDFPDAVLNPRVKRHIHLDMFRVCAVVLVAIDHRQKIYSKHNVLYSQSWTLQLLWVICGISWTLTRKPLIGYLWRLGVYFLMGVLVNLSAWIMVGKDPREDPHNVVFQMFFIVGLGSFAAVTSPLKPVLRQCRVSKGARARVETAAICDGAPAVGLAPDASSNLAPDAVHVPRPFFKKPKLLRRERRRAGGKADLAPLVLGKEDLESAQAPAPGKESLGDSASSVQPPVEVELERAREDTDSGLPGDSGGGQAALSTPEKEDVSMSLALFLFMAIAQAFLMLALGFLLQNTKSSFVAELLTSAGGHGSGYWTRNLEDRNFIGQFMSSAGAYVIVYLGAKTLRGHPERLAWLTWALMAYIYTARIFVVPWLYGACKAERLFVGLELFLVGLTAAKAGLKGAAMLRNFIHKYYFLLLLLATWLWDPVWTTRWDEHPPEDIWTLFRVKMSEALFLIMFLAAGELAFDPAIYTEDHCQWLGNWSLLVFLIHKAIHILFDQPYNWIILIGSHPVYWFLVRGHKLLRRHGREKRANEQASIA